MNTSFKEALNALDKINTTLVESAHTDELFKLTKEIAQLEKEIRELEDQKRKGWSDKYNARLEADWYKLCELEDELKELQDSYTYYTYDEDGHKDDSWEDEKKKAEQRETLLRESLMKAMQENGISEYETDKIKITLIAESTRVTLDSKAVKEKYPNVYEECQKSSTIKPTIRITLRGKKDE